MTLALATQIVAILVAGCAAWMAYLYRDRFGFAGVDQDTVSDPEFVSAVDELTALVEREREVIAALEARFRFVKSGRKIYAIRVQVEKQARWIADLRARQPPSVRR